MASRLFLIVLILFCTILHLGDSRPHHTRNGGRSSDDSSPDDDNYEGDDQNAPHDNHNKPTKNDSSPITTVDSLNIDTNTKTDTRKVVKTWSNNDPNEDLMSTNDTLSDDPMKTTLSPPGTEKKDDDSDLSKKDKKTEEEEDEESSLNSKEKEELELLKHSRQNDPEHFYRAPGGFCNESYIDKKVELYSPKSPNLVDQYNIARSHCLFHQKTHCAQVSTKPEEFRCVCKPGLTWEDGSCLAYDGQPCRWHNDCVRNARCAFDLKILDKSKMKAAADRADEDLKYHLKQLKARMIFDGYDELAIYETLRAYEGNLTDTGDKNGIEEEDEGGRKNDTLQNPADKTHPDQDYDKDDEYRRKKRDTEEDPGDPDDPKGEEPEGSEEDSNQRATKPRFAWGICHCHPFKKCQRTIKYPPFTDVSIAPQHRLKFSFTFIFHILFQFY